MSPKAFQFDPMAGRPPPPSATYRLQFMRDFTFAQAVQMLDYLRDLGVTEVYASPLFQAGSDSTHGYDVCSFARFNPVLGGREGFDAFSAQLQGFGLGLLLDVVPNHMGSDLANCWWSSVLELGPASPVAAFFDIDWQPVDPELRGKVLLPVLEDHYAHVLESGMLRLAAEHGALVLAYHHHRFPLSPQSGAIVLEETARALASAGHEKLAGEVRADLRVERDRPRDGSAPVPAESVSHCIRRWSESSAAFRSALERTCQDLNGVPGQPKSFDRLHALISVQHYQLALWRTGPERINYRRFFDVTQLVCMRMELPSVFHACHKLVFELLRKGQVTGLRVDHPDGLLDPKDYFCRLQTGSLLAQSGSAHPEELEPEAQAWLRERVTPVLQQELHRPISGGTSSRVEGPRRDLLAGQAPRPLWPLYVVAEKILSPHERLRRDWPVEGTTGYDFLNHVNGLFVDGDNEAAFDRLYADFAGSTVSFPALVSASKKRILDLSLVSELSALTHRLKAVARRTRQGQDFTARQLRRALTEVIAAFPVYRIYVDREWQGVIPQERFFLEQALAQARTYRPRLDERILDFIQDLLLLHSPPDLDEEGQRCHREFVFRFQQLTGPVMAKGLEDTALYNYNRLLSLNEVGGHPAQFGVSVEAFHQHNLEKAEHWPHALLATATHDTKRGEDARARLNVLSELPEEWAAALRRWKGCNEGHKEMVGEQPAPHPNDEYFIYQTLLGAWPFASAGLLDPASPELNPFRERIAAYLIKALREGKTRTDWTQPNEAYERAACQFLDRILDASRSREFLDDFQALLRRVAFFGVLNSLSQLLLKITSPGVPDIYQGTELWDFSLVDPDNRRPVDYDLRRRWLGELSEQVRRESGQPLLLLRRTLQQPYTGEIKLFVTATALRFRLRHRDLFRQGAYLPLPASGSKSRHLCAFARVHAGQAALTITPRLVVGLTGGREDLRGGLWRETQLGLPAALCGRYRDLFTGRTVDCRAALRVAGLLEAFPLALLERVAS